MFSIFRSIFYDVKKSPGQYVDTGLYEAHTLEHDGLHVLVQLRAQLDACEVRVDQQVHLTE